MLPQVEAGGSQVFWPGVASHPHRDLHAIAFSTWPIFGPVVGS